jgi:hypothetical protein
VIDRLENHTRQWDTVVAFYQRMPLPLGYQLKARPLEPSRPKSLHTLHVPLRRAGGPTAGRVTFSPSAAKSGRQRHPVIPRTADRYALQRFASVCNRMRRLAEPQKIARYARIVAVSSFA